MGPSNFQYDSLGEHWIMLQMATEHGASAPQIFYLGKDFNPFPTHFKGFEC